MTYKFVDTKRPTSWGKLLVVALIGVLAIIWSLFAYGYVQLPQGDDAIDKLTISEMIDEECADGDPIYDTLAEGKEVKFAYGTDARFNADGTTRTIEEQLAEFHVRRCHDPLRTAADLAYTGVIQYSVANIEAEHQRLLADRDAWREAVATLEAKEATAISVTNTTMVAGTPSLYMKPNANGGIDVLQGFTTYEGTALTFTFADGTVFRYRLNCGYQPDIPTWYPPLPPICTPTQVLDVVGCLEKKDGSQSSIAGNDEDHTVSNEDGATVSNGLQTDPAADAAAAEAAANAAAAAAAAEAEKLRQEAINNGAGTQDDDDHAGEVPEPTWDD